MLLKRNGSTQILFQDLSDGYRSMLALSVDLLRWLAKSFPNHPDPLSCPGVVLVDELDSHLHPSWQRTIGHWLREKFPQIQFIIATHSPFMAQVAGPVSGVGGLAAESGARPGGNIRLKETAQGVVAEPSAEPARMLGPEQILLSGLFDMQSMLSPQVEQGMLRLTTLKSKQREAALAPDEAKELEQLELDLERIPAASSPEERAAETALRAAVQKVAGKIQALE